MTLAPTSSHDTSSTPPGHCRTRSACTSESIGPDCSIGGGCDSWLRIKDAAPRLAISERQLYRLCELRMVPFRRVPGTSVIAFAPEDLARIAEMSRVEPLKVS